MFFFLAACTPDALDPIETIEQSANYPVPMDDEGVEAHEASEAYVEAVQDHVGSMKWNLNEAEPIHVVRPDGTEEDLFLIDGDIEVTRQQLTAMRDADGDPRHYNTYELVNDFAPWGRTIQVVGYTGATTNLTPVMQTGLSWAVWNLNNVVNTNLTFNLSFASNVANADIIVYRDPNDPRAGGVAGFPIDGSPYRWVRIYQGMNNLSNNANEHVAMHEILHCIGLRHVDWQTRASCGQNTSEAENPAGAVYIPGTPLGNNANSNMQACFSAATNGELNFFDRVALEYLY